MLSSLLNRANLLLHPLHPVTPLRVCSVSDLFECRIFSPTDCRHILTVETSSAIWTTAKLCCVGKRRLGETPRTNNSQLWIPDVVRYAFMLPLSCGLSWRISRHVERVLKFETDRSLFCAVVSDALVSVLLKIDEVDLAPRLPIWALPCPRAVEMCWSSTVRCTWRVQGKASRCRHNVRLQQISRYRSRFHEKHEGDSTQGHEMKHKS